MKTNDRFREKCQTRVLAVKGICMKLKELLTYDDIVIQCHDNPDADAMGSAYGLYCYFKEKDPQKDVRIIYSGDYQIEKSNLKLMIQELEIPIAYVSELVPPDLLITVDCQYGNGNVVPFQAKQVAVVDHHQISSPELPGMKGFYGQPEILSAQFVEIHNTLGSCCTVVYKLLKAAGFDINQNENLATALYYGLYRDTKRCSEIYSEDDKKLRDHAHYNK
ncbi:MAG: DHH family phosphoesterase, partial [Blautia sp.]|nr:DHH family phosphoesterase [Blautia sp.]